MVDHPPGQKNKNYFNILKEQFTQKWKLHHCLTWHLFFISIYGSMKNIHALQK